jgi:hypothetical protein
MAKLRSFVNNPYQENTYILFDDTRECVIIDPGMYTASEQNAVVNFIKDNQLKPVLLLNTHCPVWPKAAVPYWGKQCTGGGTGLRASDGHALRAIAVTGSLPV